MMAQWAMARADGSLTSHGWRGGPMSQMEMAKAEGKSKSNASQVAELEEYRRSGLEEQDHTERAIDIAGKQSPMQVAFMKFHYVQHEVGLAAQTKMLARSMPGITQMEYEAHIESALYLVDRERKVIVRNTNRIKQQLEEAQEQ